MSGKQAIWAAKGRRIQHIQDSLEVDAPGYYNVSCPGSNLVHFAKTNGYSVYGYSENSYGVYGGSDDGDAGVLAHRNGIGVSGWSEHDHVVYGRARGLATDEGYGQTQLAIRGPGLP